MEISTTRVTEKDLARQVYLDALYNQVLEDARTWDPEKYSKNEVPDDSPGPEEDR